MQPRVFAGTRAGYPRGLRGGLRVGRVYPSGLRVRVAGRLLLPILGFWRSLYIQTVGLSKVKDITIYYIFEVYNRLFRYFRDSQKRLYQKKVPQKKAILYTLKAREQKLITYYKDTKKAYRYLYIIGTILIPIYKLNYFKGVDQASNNIDWYIVYKSSLYSYLK